MYYTGLATESYGNASCPSTVFAFIQMFMASQAIPDHILRATEKVFLTIRDNPHSAQRYVFQFITRILSYEMSNPPKMSTSPKLASHFGAHRQLRPVWTFTTDV